MSNIFFQEPGQPLRIAYQSASKRIESFQERLDRKSPEKIVGDRINKEVVEIRKSLKEIELWKGREVVG